MSDSVIFDQLSFVKRGVDVGVPREHAEWLAQEYTQLLEKNLATKTDVANIQHAIEQLRATTQRDIERSKNDLTWRVIGLFIVFSGIIVTGFFAALQMYLP